MVLFLAGSSYAQDTAAKATARALANEGAEMLAAGDYAGALERLSKADELVHVATVRLLVARAQEKLGRLSQAQATYRSILAEPVDAKTPKPIQEAIKTAAAELDALLPRVPQIQVTVVGPDVKSTKVQLDSTDVPPGDVGAWLPLDPGSHKLHAESEGWEPVDVELDLKESERKPVPLTLTKHEEPAVVAPAPVAAPPPPPPPAAPPRPAAEALHPSTGAPPPPPDGDSPPKRGGAQRTLGYIGIGMGTIGLVAGGVTGMLAMQKKQELSDSCTDDKHCYPDAEGRYDDARSLARLSTIGFIAGGALVATGFILVVTSPRHPADAASGASSPTLALRLGPGAAFAEGTF